MDEPIRRSGLVPHHAEIAIAFFARRYFISIGGGVVVWPPPTAA